MSLALVGSAMADGAVVNNTNHTYNVYQIFSGTQTPTAGDTKLGDIEWGSGINSSAFLTALQSDSRFNAGVPAANVFASALEAKDVADALASNPSMAEAFANVAAQNLGSTVIATVTGNAVSPELPAGYYLFVDTSTVTTDDALNSALLQITNTTLTIAKKYDVPSFDKDIIEGSSNVEAVDKAIGDTVTYELKGTLPSNYADYETYKYVFHDTISAGQAIDFDSFTITLNSATGTDISALFVNSLTEDTDGSAETTFTLTASNLKTNTSIDADSEIYVRYNVTITADAVIGSTGNENEGYIEYSNNPNNTGSGEPTSTTPEDHTLVFTYELQPTKVDGTDPNTKLTGAQFVLRATNGDHSGQYVQIDASTHKLTGWTSTKPTAVDTVPTSGNTGVLVSAAGGLFEVYGLDSGTYELEEIKAPVGYNLLTNAIEIVIEANVDDSEDNPALNELTITIDGHKDDTNRASTGILPMTVENNGGATLPATGGIGTTIFYIVGAVLVLGAAAVILARRKAEQQ